MKKLFIYLLPILLFQCAPAAVIADPVITQLSNTFGSIVNGG
jgi:hypothetical protein